MVMNTANDEWSNSMDQFTFKSYCIATDVRYESNNMIIDINIGLKCKVKRATKMRGSPG